MKKLLTLLLLFVSGWCVGQDQRVWATYYGGEEHEDTRSIATDINGNIYIAGTTQSHTGIALNGFQNYFGGDLTDCYLAKFDSLGNRLWASYYGGNGQEECNCIATDTFGNIYMAGYTLSTSNIASGGYQNTFGNAGGLAFLVKFNADGNRLWATYYGGTVDGSYATGNSVATDLSGNVFLSGGTRSILGIADNGFQNNYAGGNWDAFLVKFDTNGNRLWGTYYGGADEDYGYGITTDALENIYLCGWTYSTSGISSGGFQDNILGNDAFLVKFDSFGNREWGTYYGGESGDYGYKVTTDISGNVYMTGETYSFTGIYSHGFQSTHYANPNGNILDLFLAKFDASGNRIWATYYGGTNEEEGGNVATDSYGNVYLSGDTYSDSSIAFEGFQNNLIGMENQFVAKFDSNGTRLCATYYGFVHDEGCQIALDNFGHLYLTGFSISPIGIASDEFQTTYTSGWDSYLVKFKLFENDIIVEINDTLQIPDIITPNGDNQNDYFEIKNLNVLSSNNTLVIYNRWGKKLYEKTDYKNDWNGDKQSAGTYFYVLRLQTGETKTGTITIIR